MTDSPDTTHSGAPAPTDHTRSRIRGLLGPGPVVLCLGLAAIMLVPALLGMQRYVITGGSMAGTYDPGSIVFDEVVSTRDLKVGDVITYTPPGRHDNLTHRIASITSGPHGERVYRTKGDANGSIDPWHFTLTRPTQARVSFAVPYVGYAFAALGVRWVRMLVIGLPGLLIGIAVFLRMWREAGEAASVDSGDREPGAVTG